MGMCGWAYVAGGGVEKDVAHGFMLLGQAAAEGSEVACKVLGDEFAYGRNTKRDPAEAAKWLRKVVWGHCLHRNNSTSVEESSAGAASWLRQYDLALELGIQPVGF